MYAAGENWSVACKAEKCVVPGSETQKRAQSHFKYPVTRRRGTGSCDQISTDSRLPLGYTLLAAHSNHFLLLYRAHNNFCRSRALIG